MRLEEGCKKAQTALFFYHPDKQVFDESHARSWQIVSAAAAVGLYSILSSLILKHVNYFN